MRHVQLTIPISKKYWSESLYFELSLMIERPPSDVFAFLRDKDLYPQDPESPVLELKKTTDGPPALGTRYREVIQMLPIVRGEIFSEITRYEPGRYLEEHFEGAGMRGCLATSFALRAPSAASDLVNCLGQIAPFPWFRGV